MSALLGAVALVVPVGAAQAATPGPWQGFTAYDGAAGFVRMGHVTGHPGNAHSGDISFDTSEHGTRVYLSDWNCAAGHQPVYYGPSDDGCVLLSRTYDEDRTAADPTFSGVLNATYQGQDLVHGDFPTVTDTGRTAAVKLRWVRSGPVTRTRTDNSTATEDDFTTITTAPMRLTGTVDWVNLSSPRVHVTVTSYVRIDDRYRFLS